MKVVRYFGSEREAVAFAMELPEGRHPVIHRIANNDTGRMTFSVEWEEQK